jgi:hypothetical protein
MKQLTVPLCLLLFAGAAPAQERIPDEEARKLAKVLAVAATKKAKAPIATDADPDKAFGKRRDEHGGLFIPDKKLTAERLRKAGKDEVVPVGQCWLRNLAPVVDNKVLTSSKLQIVPVTYDGQEFNLAVCFLAARQGEKGLELLVYSKDKTPLLKLPLKKDEIKQELPVEFSTDVEDDRARLTMHLVGAYQTKLTVAPLTE